MKSPPPPKKIHKTVDLQKIDAESVNSFKSQ